MGRRGNPPNFMNGVPELLLLGMLADGGEMYGYQLVKAVRERTGDAISLSEGVVYPMLHALEHDRYLASRRREVDGRPRVYYRLTRKGERRLGQVTEDWTGVTRAIAGILGRSSDAVEPV